MTTLALLALALAAVRAADTLTTVSHVSGVQVIHRINPGSDVVAVRLFLLGGTLQLTAATAGIEAFVLRAAEVETRQAMARIGGLTITEAGADWTVTGFDGLKQDFRSAWSVFARRLTHPTLSDAAVARARDELFAVTRERYSDPDLRIQVIAQQAAFVDHPYGLDPWGTESSLATLRREDLATYAREQFVTSRMLLVVVADVSRALLESLVAATLGSLPRGTYRWTLPPPVTRRPSRWFIEHRPLPTNYILGYFTGPDPTQSDYDAFWVATELLSSRLNRYVREARSLSYAVYAPFLDRAVPVGGIYASTSKPADVYALMIREIWLLQNAESYGFVLSRYLDQFTLDQLTQNLTSAGQAEALGRAHLYFGDHRIADQFVRRLRTVRAPDVRRAATKYLRNIQLAYLGDTARMLGKW